MSAPVIDCPHCGSSAVHLTFSCASCGRSDPKTKISMSLLIEILEFLEDQEDVRDGSDGVPQPNTAMHLAGELRRAIGEE